MSRDANDVPAAPGERPWRARHARLVRIGIGVIAALAALFFYRHARTFDVHAFGAALSDLGIASFVIAVCGAPIVDALQSFRWWVLLREIVHYRFRDAVAARFGSALMNIFLPARAGDVVRIHRVSAHTSSSRTTLLGLELVDFCADKCGWLPSFALFAMMGTPPRWMSRALVLALVAAVVLAIVVGAFRDRLLAHAERGDGIGARLAAGLAASSPAKIAKVALVISPLSWVWETLVIYATAHVAGIPLSPLSAFALLTALNVAMIAAIPGNAGVHEIASSAVLVTLGVPIERAVAFGLLYHASRLVSTMTFGLLSGVLVRAQSVPGRSSSPPRSTRADV
jgi:uncharacterized membrane protein YbhN (UPF0104 family)